MIGRTLRIDGVPVTIVGVGPVGHRGTINVGFVTDFWLPIASLPSMGMPPRLLERRPEEAAFLVKARLRDGVTVVLGQAAMRILGARLASEYPQEDPGKGISVFASSDVRVHPQMDGALRWVALVLLVVVGLVLGIACSNLATLLLVRDAARAKEVSVRLALGATRRQLVRHLLMESLPLSAAGGRRRLRPGRRVLVFAVGLSLVTGVAFGLTPALEATSVDLVPTLRDDGETRSADHRRLTPRPRRAARSRRFDAGSR